MENTTCPCASSLTFGAPGSRERWAHNDSLEHRTLLAEQIGRPEIALAWTPGTPEYDARLAVIAEQSAKWGTA
jgi:hypothetical protein